MNWILPPPPPVAHPGTTWTERIERASRTRADWDMRSAQIRVQILTAAGLWPEFDRPPLKAEVYGRVDKDGYSVEKVVIETWPGLKLTGNLYRPSGGKGPHPAVLSLHGHWEPGRFNDTELGSQPGRAIGLARLGFVVLATDMVGYGDNTQLPHRFGDIPWGVTVLGIQLWNNIRAVDFLASLADVDPARIGATGESGGGTQTFLLAAVDPRIACSVPVNMVTAGCQGGCLCENAPLLRIDLNNVEIAAAVAPRPLMLISCTGDWTAKMPERDAPVVGRAYSALGVPDRFRVARVTADHNYNKESRELAYSWLAQWLLNAPEADRLPETPFQAGTAAELTVWDTAHPRPANLLNVEGMAESLRKAIRNQITELYPSDSASLARFRGLMLLAMRYTLTARFPLADDLERKGDGVRYRYLPGSLDVRGDGKEKVITVVTTAEAGKGHGRIIVLGPHDRESPCNSDADTGAEEYIHWRENFPLTYYRTGLARDVQDVLTAVAAFGGPGVALEGSGRAGIAVLLARALMPEGHIGKTVVDLGGFDELAPGAWTGDRELPGILRIGGLRTAAILAAPGELEIRGAGGLDVSPVRVAYRAAGHEGAFTVSR